MDTRVLFDHWTCRKACSWEHVNEIPYKKLTGEMIDALKGKSRLYVGPDVDTFDDVFVQGSGCDDIEFILVREMDDDGRVEAYYVNTEGYSYARYTLRLPVEMLSELKIEGRY